MMNKDFDQSQYVPLRLDLRINDECCLMLRISSRLHVLSLDNNLSYQLLPLASICDSLCTDSIGIV